MDLNTILVYVVGAVAVTFLLRYIVATQAVLGLNMKAAVYKRVDRELCPETVRAFYEIMEKELDLLGFDYLFCFTTQLPGANIEQLRYVFVYYHPVEKTYAASMISVEADNLVPFSVEFSTYFKDGVKLNTGNGISHTLVADIPGVILRDYYTRDLDTQWQYHKKSLEEFEDKEIMVFPETPEGYDSMLEENADAQRRYIETLEKNGKVYRVKDSKDTGIYLLKTLPALAFAQRMISGITRMARVKRQIMMERAERQRAGHPVDVVDIPAQLEADYFIFSAAMSRQKYRNTTGKFIILLITAAMFLVGFGILFNFKTAFVLLVAIGIHEAGHLAAMAFCGYKDLKMLFIPLFGAVAMGSAKNVPAYKKVITFFAGPLPGILMGFGLYILFKNAMLPTFFYPYAVMAIIILLVVNYFNLLPIMPLDGGQILNTVIFSRYSVLQFVFFIFSVAGLALLGIYLKEPLLLILAMVTPLSYKGHFVRRNLTVTVEEKLRDRPDVSEKEIADTIFTQLKDAQYTKYTLQRKIALAQYVAENFRAPKAGTGTVIATLLLYAVIFVVPIVFYVLPRLSNPRALFFSDTGPCGVVEEYKPKSGGDTGDKTAVTDESRFMRLEGEQEPVHRFSCFRYCFFSGNHDVETVSPAAFLSRVWKRFGPPEKMINGFYYRIEDTVTGVEFKAVCKNLVMIYTGNSEKLPLVVKSLYRFEELLSRTDPVEFEYKLSLDFSKVEGNRIDPKALENDKSLYVYLYRMGFKNGLTFMEPVPVNDEK